METSALNGCWRCNGFLLMDPATLAALKRAGAPVYCNPCRKIVTAEQARIPVEPGVRCVHVDYQSGPFADLRVKSVDGEHVTVHSPIPADRPDIAERWWPSIMRGRTVFHRGELIMKGR